MDFRIEAPRKSPVPRAAEDLVFDVEEVVVEGSTVYGAEELRPVLAPLAGKNRKLADLLAAVERIEKRYHDDGYVLTRVYLPRQSVVDGRFRIDVAEGYLAGISVDGGDEASRARVERLMAPVRASKPLKLSVLEEALLLANSDPGIQVTSLIRPSATEPKASDLLVTVTAPGYFGSVAADNRGAANTGVWTWSASVAARSPFEDGGQIQLAVSASPEVNQRRAVQARYSLPSPFGLDGLVLSLGGLLSHGEPAGSVLRLRMVSDGASIGPRATYPLIQGRQVKLSLDGGLTLQSSDIHALGAPLSHDEWRVADLGLLYQDSRFLWGAADASLTAAQGIPSLGASATRSAGLTRPGSATDFFKLSGQLRTVQGLGGGFSLSVTGQWQYSRDTLVVGEEVSFGSAGIGRGYDPASITGDSGLGGAFELRYDLAPASLDLDALRISDAQLYGFYDTAQVWLNTPAPAGTAIASVGGGVRMSVFENLSVGVEIAKSLAPVPTSDGGRGSLRGLFNGSIRF